MKRSDATCGPGSTPSTSNYTTYPALYDLSREDREYILSTFPIVRREDEAQFGQYRTGDLILVYMNALASGDAESVIDL